MSVAILGSSPLGRGDGVSIRFVQSAEAKTSTAWVGKRDGVEGGEAGGRAGAGWRISAKVMIDGQTGSEGCHVRSQPTFMRDKLITYPPTTRILPVEGKILTRDRDGPPSFAMI